MNQNTQHILAKSISGLFHPLLMPIYLSAVMLFFPVFAPLIPLRLKWIILGVVSYCFMLLPVTILLILHRYGKIESIHLEKRSDRFLPMFLITICYVIGLRVMAVFDAPGTLLLIMRGVTLAILMVAIVSVFWKISAHMTGIGGAFGISVLLSMMYFQNLSHLAISIVLLAGLLAWSRLYLKHHNYRQVYYGFFLGFIAMMISFLLHAIM